MASPLFCKSLRHDLSLELLLDVHLAQASVLFLLLLHARHQRGVHATELGSPLVKRRRADTQLSAELGVRPSGLCLLECINDLAVGETRFLHGRDSPLRVSTSSRIGFLGGLPFVTQCLNSSNRQHQSLNVKCLERPHHPRNWPLACVVHHAPA